MPKFIVKLHDYYMEFSTIVDAPTTFGMKRAEFEDYYRKQYGESGMRELPARMERVDANGTSALNKECVADMMRFNHAGPNERRLSIKQIYESHCLMQPIKIRGKRWQLDENGRWRALGAVAETGEV